MPSNELRDKFAAVFDNKIRVLLEEVSKDEDVCNGRQRLISNYSMFMDYNVWQH
jgi:hypothetical protein